MTNAETYRAARVRVDRQIQEIQALLHRHANLATASPDVYLAADLDHVFEVLNDAVEFLGGRRGEITR